MAPDLLSTIRSEIDERLKEMRPLMAEYEELLIAADALVKEGRESAAAAKPSVSKSRTSRAPRTAKATKATAPAGKSREAKPKSADEAAGGRGSKQRAARGAARDAILAALEHGSHTLSELAVVTAMSSANLSGNLRRLHSDGAIAKTEREGKAAWALQG